MIQIYSKRNSAYIHCGFILSERKTFHILGNKKAEQYDSYRLRDADFYRHYRYSTKEKKEENINKRF